MAEVFVRPIDEADIEAVFEIESLCFAVPWSRASILRDVKENPVACWLGLDDGQGRIVAYAAMWFVLDEAHVCNIAVHPACRQRGYGRRIMCALMDTAKENLMRMMELEVRRSNLIAQNLYRSLGFVDVGYRKRYYEDNHEDALLMLCEFYGADAQV